MLPPRVVRKLDPRTIVQYRNLNLTEQTVQADFEINGDDGRALVVTMSFLNRNCLDPPLSVDGGVIQEYSCEIRLTERFQDSRSQRFLKFVVEVDVCLWHVVQERISVAEAGTEIIGSIRFRCRHRRRTHIGSKRRNPVLEMPGTTLHTCVDESFQSCRTIVHRKSA